MTGPQWEILGDDATPKPGDRIEAVHECGDEHAGIVKHYLSHPEPYGAEMPIVTTTGGFELPLEPRGAWKITLLERPLKPLPVVALATVRGTPGVVVWRVPEKDGRPAGWMDADEIRSRDDYVTEVVPLVLVDPRVRDEVRIEAVIDNVTARIKGTGGTVAAIVKATLDELSIGPDQ